MAWESRPHGGRYYTRSKRVGGRVCREYIGTGEIGALAAELDAADRNKRDVQRRSRQLEQEHIEQTDRSVTEFDELCRKLMGVALQAVGYHQHKRGEWRKRRGRKES